MMPNDDQTRRDSTPLEPQRHFLVSPNTRPRASANTAAAQVIRSQIDSIYNGNTTSPTPQTTPVVDTQSVPTAQATAQQAAKIPLELENPYERTHTPTPQPQAEQWKKYHSAWQDYYKQYYERYYVNQVYQTEQARSAQPTVANVSNEAIRTAGSADQTATKQEAMSELRRHLRERISTSTKKVRKSRHFVPIISALAVMLIFLFLQYNRVLFATVAAYVAPGNINPQSIILDPSAQDAVGPDSKLIIPKTNVDVPIIYNVSNDHATQMAAMVNGAMHFSIPGASSVPGQIGNMVVAGHSSNDLFDTGDYKFIFAQNDKLAPGDTIYIDYHSVRYTYNVTKTQTVDPTDVSALTYKTDKPILTLITCMPLGTAWHRLLVTAEQVSPDPSTAAPAPGTANTPNTSTKATVMPSNSPSFVQRLFGAQ